MELFFEILLYISFFVSIPLFIIGVERFPSWVAKIDPAKCKSGKRVDRYLEKQLFFREGRIALTAMLCTGIDVISMQFGSFPKEEIDDPYSLMAIPALLVLIIPVIGGIILGNYFFDTACKYGIYQKTTDFRTAYARTTGEKSVGIFICFYLIFILMFTIMHLFYILGLIK